jgi:hypothetical protein
MPQLMTDQPICWQKVMSAYAEPSRASGTR